jgi:hypothetical protein
MKLQEWLNHHKNCPLCVAPLTTYLHSTKRQAIKWEEGRMVVIFELRSTDKRKSSDYKVGYSFHLTENQFCIEFYSKDGIRIEKEVQPHLMDKFKSLDSNLKSYRFYRQCNSCKRYHYSSSAFKLNLKDASLYFKEPFIVSSEYFGLIQAMEQGSKTPFRIYRLLNCYTEKEIGSHLTYWSASSPHGTLSDWTVPNEATFLDLPLIPFVSINETLERIKKLILFS